MDEDDELCLCFHVTRRKVRNFIRVEQPRVASQLSACGGAGTGCGWCRKMLRRMLEEAQGHGSGEPWPDQEAYTAGRQRHLARRQSGASEPPPE